MYKSFYLSFFVLWSICCLIGACAKLEEPSSLKTRQLEKKGTKTASNNQSVKEKNQEKAKEKEQSGIVRTGPLANFFYALDHLQAGKREKVRVLHFGDSHSAADFLTTAIRRAFQKDFGDGGRGFLLPGRPWRTYNPGDVEIETYGKWETKRALIAVNPMTLDGFYGLGGISVETMDQEARTIFKTTASVFEIFYMISPSGGSLDVFVDGSRKGFVDTRGKNEDVGFFKLKVEQGLREFEIRAKDEIRLFGVVLENDQKGLVYDTSGVNGAFFYTPARWDTNSLQKQILRRDPDLIITMYGTNEVGSNELTREGYKESVKKTVTDFIEETRASCLLIGPPDRVVQEEKQEQLSLIIEIQKEAAQELGCGFLDLQAMMGGAGSHEAWQMLSPPLASSDGVHYTVRGYRLMGEKIAEYITCLYNMNNECLLNIVPDGGV